MHEPGTPSADRGWFCFRHYAQTTTPQKRGRQRIRASHLGPNGPPTWENADQESTENPRGMLVEIGAKSSPNAPHGSEARDAMGTDSTTPPRRALKPESRMIASARGSSTARLGAADRLGSRAFVRHGRLGGVLSGGGGSGAKE